jgi:hypothetical protein
METFFGIVIIVVSLVWVLISFHMIEERKRGEFLPLPWEKGGWLRNGENRKIFNKSDIKYRDGDNT